jgi:two-component system sensor histidine kinase TctE
LEGAIAESHEPEVRERLEAADREVDRLSEIVDRLLVMARQIEEGASSRVDVGEAVMRARDRWDERARSLDSTLLSSGEGGTARADPTDLDQILDNLLDNALAYAPGEITIGSALADGAVVVAVQDHGPGIPTADLVQVTERFYRGAGSPSGGSGLGLAIARQLAEKWGGGLHVSSTEGHGTRVEIRLQQAP